MEDQTVVAIMAAFFPRSIKCSLYRVTQKGWDCKDDQKLLKYDSPRGNLCILAYSLIGKKKSLQLQL